LGFVSVELIVADLIPAVLKNEHANRESDTETCNLDDGENFVSDKTPPGNGKIVFDHNSSSCWCNTICWWQGVGHLSKR
jgi:hypothetical protein